MVNTPKIKGRITELSLSQNDVAKALGIAQSTLNQKINNIRPINLNEAEKIQKLLQVPDSEFTTYFFT